MAKAVFCLANDTTQAEAIIEDLKSAGIPNNDISILFPDKGMTRDFAHEKQTKAPEGYSVGVGSGGIIGGVLGWLAGIGALAIPGLGPFIAAGPIMAALSGAAVGSALGGVIGALVGLGIPEIVAKQYESKIKSGNILISVHAATREVTGRVKEIFSNRQAQDISASEESAVSRTESTEEDSYYEPTTTQQEGFTMNKLNIKGNWNILKGKLKQKYAQLSDDDLTYVEGKEDELIGKLQKKLGVSADEIRNMLSAGEL